MELACHRMCDRVRLLTHTDGSFTPNTGRAVYRDRLRLLRQSGCAKSRLSIASGRCLTPAQPQACPAQLTTTLRCYEDISQPILLGPRASLAGRHSSTHSSSRCQTSRVRGAWLRCRCVLPITFTARWCRTEFMVAAPLGVHPLVVQALHERLEHCVARSNPQNVGTVERCNVCLQGSHECVVHVSPPAHEEAPRSSHS